MFFVNNGNNKQNVFSEESAEYLYHYEEEVEVEVEVQQKGTTCLSSFFIHPFHHHQHHQPI